MSLYSHKGKFPKELPYRLRLDSGTTLSDLKNLSEKELKDLGFTGPFIPPAYYPDRGEILEWDGQKFLIEKIITTTSTNEEDISGVGVEQPIPPILINISDFIKSNAFLKIREESSENLKLNILYTELTDFFSDETLKSSEFLVCIMKILNFLSDESALIVKEYFTMSNEVLQYNFNTDRFANDPNDELGIPPIEYPLDGKNYTWDKKNSNWIIVE